MAMAGSDADVNRLVRSYFERQALSTPNWYNYDRTELELEGVRWNDTTPVTPHQGLTRTVTVEDKTDSAGNVSVTVNQAAVSVRVHLTAGRFHGNQKMVNLSLPRNKVFENFNSIEFDVNKEKTDVTQKSVPVKVVDEALSSFKKVKVTSSTAIFEGSFVCTARLSGKVITNIGQADISDIVRSQRSLPQPFSGAGGALTWPVRGIAEFTMDSQTRVQ